MVTGVFDTEGTDVEVPLCGEGDTRSVACSLSSQFAGCPVAFVPVSR